MAHYPPVSSQQLELSLLQKVNEWRSKKHAHILRTNERLRQLARCYSKDMAQRRFFAHVDPDGRSLKDRLWAAGISFQKAGENLASIVHIPPKLQEMTDEVVYGWLESSGHRHNIEDKDFLETGLGVFQYKDTYFIAQIFLKK